MQHFIRRCRHCGKEYIYCTYGNGPDWGTEENCTMDYCGECGTAVKNALSKIPEDRYVASYHKIDGLDPDTDVRYKVLLANNNIEQNDEKNNHPLWIRFDEAIQYQVGMVVIKTIIDSIEYRISYKEDTPDDVCVERLDEFDNIKKEYTGKPYRKFEIDNLKIIRGKGLTFEQELVPVKPMDSPSSLIHFLDFPQK